MKQDDSAILGITTEGDCAIHISLAGRLYLGALVEEVHQRWLAVGHQRLNRRLQALGHAAQQVQRHDHERVVRRVHVRGQLSHLYAPKVAPDGNAHQSVHPTASYSDSVLAGRTCLACS